MLFCFKFSSNFDILKAGLDFIRCIKKKYKAKTNPETNSPEEIQEFLDEIENGMVELLMEPDICRSPYNSVEAAIDEVRDLVSMSSCSQFLSLTTTIVYSPQHCQSPPWFIWCRHVCRP